MSFLFYLFVFIFIFWFLKWNLLSGGTPSGRLYKSLFDTTDYWNEVIFLWDFNLKRLLIEELPPSSSFISQQPHVAALGLINSSQPKNRSVLGMVILYVIYLFEYGIDNFLAILSTGIEWLVLEFIESNIEYSWSNQGIRMSIGKSFFFARPLFFFRRYS